LTTALEGGEWSAARPGRTLPPGKTRYPLDRMLGGPQDRSGRAENLAPLGFDPRTAKSVVSRWLMIYYPEMRIKAGIFINLWCLFQFHWKWFSDVCVVV